MKSNRVTNKTRIAAGWVAVCLLTLSLVGCTDRSERTTWPVDTTSEITSSTTTVADSAETTLNIVEDLDAKDLVLTLDGFGSGAAQNDQDLSVLDMLTYAMQDEYAARSEYEAILEAYGDRSPYRNIKRSEETHIAYLTDIFNSYNLEIPEDDSSDHVVLPDSLLAAAEIGVQAEINNIDMYNRFLTNPLPQDIADVFISLRDASENHLAAFEKQVDKLS